MNAAIAFQMLKSGQLTNLLPYLFYKAVRSKEAKATKPIATAAEDEKCLVEIHTLTGSNNIADCIIALKSFVLHFPERVALTIHCDSTVSPEEYLVLSNHLPTARLTTPSLRDRKTLAFLNENNLSHCSRFRKENIFSVKLIDAILLSRNENILLLDTDVIAFRPLTELHAALLNYSGPIYAVDPVAHPYSVSNKYARAHFGADIKPHLCAGFCAFQKSHADFDRIERMLSSPGYPMSCHYAEQTIHAALSSNERIHYLSPNTYNTGRTVQENDAALIHYCGHYLSSTRIAMRKVGQRRALNNIHAATYEKTNTTTNKPLA